LRRRKSACPLAFGRELEAEAVYLDADLDITLLKVDRQNLPTLGLAEVTATHQGQNVVAKGNPGEVMLFRVTKGTASAVGKFPNAGPHSIALKFSGRADWTRTL
jgi:S1-C subfamily serine protease